MSNKGCTKVKKHIIIESNDFNRDKKKNVQKFNSLKPKPNKI